MCVGGVGGGQMTEWKNSYLEYATFLAVWWLGLSRHRHHHPCNIHHRPRNHRRHRHNRLPTQKLRFPWQLLHPETQKKKYRSLWCNYISLAGSGGAGVGARAALHSRSNFLHFHAVYDKDFTKQECIPAGCVPSAAVVVCPGGVHPPPWTDRHPVFSLTLAHSPMASRSYQWASDFLNYSPRLASDI